MEIELEPWQKTYVEWATTARLDNWKKVGLLEDNVDKHIEVCTGLMMENQRLMNEMSDYQQEKKKGYIKLISKFFPALLAHRLVSVQPKLGPNTVIYYTRYGFANDQLNLLVENEDCVAKTRKYRLRFPENEETLADQMAEDIDREILTDLCNNCGTVGTSHDPDHESLWSHICEMMGNISKKALTKPTWIVIHPTMAQKYQKTFNVFKNGYNIYVTDNIQHDRILIGCKGERYIDSQYIWAPYIMVAPTPPVLDPEFIPRPGYLVRYGKKLTRSGSKHYGRITLTQKEAVTA